MLKKFMNGELGFNDLKDGIYFKVSHRDKAGDNVYKEVGDLALTYWIRLVESTGMGGIRISASVSEKLMDAWGITIDELDATARENTARMFPAEVKTSSELLGIMEENTFICVTNAEKKNGASAVFYDGMLDSLAEIFGGDFYLIPSSIHEMLAVRPEGFDPSFFNAAIKECNKELLMEPEEVLSDHAYRYLATERRLVSA